MPKFIRLTDYKNSNDKEKGFFDPKNRYTAKQKDFSKIPESPISYWASKSYINSFNNENIKALFDPRKGLVTLNDKLFIKDWYEVDFNLIGFDKINVVEFDSSNKKYCPYKSGGGFRRWYGNRFNVIDWENNGNKLKKYITEKSGDHYSRQIFNQDKYFKRSISWNSISSSKSSFRFHEEGFIFGSAGPSLFPEQNLKFLLGLLNSKITDEFIKIINPTFNFGPKVIGKIPFIQRNKGISNFVLTNISISKTEWDSRENSWDFKNNELIRLIKDNSIISSYISFCSYWKEKFYTLHKNEEELNKLFIDIYNLQDELTPDVDINDITILKTEATINNNELVFQKDEILEQLLSYSLGTFMGRYRLDKPGLQIAHPDPTNDEISPYQYNNKTFEIDDDAIIPLMGSNCGFSDDIVYRVKSFIELVWGEETLTENINFIEEALGKDLEKYLINDMWKYHVKMYKKKPIYWLFSSPKGAFQVVVYMHRMNKFTVQKIRNHYLLPHINYLAREIEVLKNNEANLSKEESRRLTNLIKDELECKEYEKIVKDLADKQIEFDLDDGVTVNHKKFEEIVEKIK